MAEDDGLEMPVVGAWAKDKYHFLSRYLDLFSTGMKNKWGQLHYIDLFSGAGYAKIKDKNELVDTSAIIAITTKDPFYFHHFCERDTQKCHALTKRLEKRSGSRKYNVLNKDANECIEEILSLIPLKKCLAVAFCDPFGLHFDFATATALSKRHVDLIVLLADNMDAMRNWKKYYRDNPNSTLDKFMGESGWREQFENETSSNSTFAERFRKRYQERLRSLGYSHFGVQQIQNSSNRDIYSLLFASTHERGLDFWQKAKSVDASGQRALFGG